MQLKQVLANVALKSAEYLPAAQSVHGPEAVDALYFPAKQAVHALPVYPGLQ